MEKKVYCHWDLVRFISEKHLKQEDGSFLTLSVTDGVKYELMIFLGKTDSNYEVRVYKCESNGKYVPHETDRVKSFEENDECATFFFDKFEDAHEFTDMLGYFHQEYKVRPYRKIE